MLFPSAVPLNEFSKRLFRSQKRLSFTDIMAKRPEEAVLANVKQTKIARMVQGALDGNRQALKYLKLGTQYISYQKTTMVSWGGLMSDYKFAATAWVASSHLNCELIQRLSKRLLHYIKFNAKGYNSEIDEDARRVSVGEQLEMLQFMCADLPLARMPDTVDREDEESSSDEDHYLDYGNGDGEEKMEEKGKGVKGRRQHLQREEKGGEAFW